jgi:hypothetical protein
MTADRGAAGTRGALAPVGPDDDRLASLPAVIHLHPRDVAVAGASGGRPPLWRGRLGGMAGWTVELVG